MRWDELFADLEAQAEQLSVQERSVEVGDLARAEFGRVVLVDRMRPSIGAVVTVRALGEARVNGELRRVGPDWLLVDEAPAGQALVALAAVLSVAGLVRLIAPPDSAGRVESRLGLRSVLRAVARDRSPARVQLTDGALLTGTVDRVGSDFLELASHPGAPARRRDEVREILTVPFTALAVVRRMA